MEDCDLISNLQSQVESLRSRVRELLDENGNLSSRLMGCSCNRKEEKLDGCGVNGVKSVGEIGNLKKDGGKKSKKKVRQQIPGNGSTGFRSFWFFSNKLELPTEVLGNPNNILIRRKKKLVRLCYVVKSILMVTLMVAFTGMSYIIQREMTKGFLDVGDDMRNMTRFCKRYVALKVMYFGQRFYGFASEAQMDPTVESEIFKALEKTRLAVGDRKELQYSRCGRTDKGVSSVGQVISLFLRSNLKENDMNNSNSGDHNIKEYEGEIDYVGLLNRVLPRDIRVIGWCPVPVDFSARFSCTSREYKYFFWRDNLDLLAMENAAKKFIGEHDFRNFCKMDALNVHNYRRKITYFEIFPSDVRFDGSQLYAIKIKGTAFLWHQVRCMVAVLFMIGQGLESPEVVDILLDTEKTQRKPQYVMALEIPLVLRSCEFEGLKFTCPSDAGQALRAHLKNESRAYHLHAAIVHEALLNCLPLATDQSISHKVKSNRVSHVPLLSRPTEPTYDERRAKLSSGTRFGDRLSSSNI